MRRFLIPAVATTALALTVPAPAAAQIVIGGNSPYFPRYSAPFTPYRVVPPAAPTAVQTVTGGMPVGSLATVMRSLGWPGYGPFAGYPYAGNYGPLTDRRAFGFVPPARYAPWSGYQPFQVNPPTSNWKPVDPRSSNPGLHRGWFKGGGKRR